MVDLNGVELPHDSPVIEILVDLVLSDRVFDVVALDFLSPTVVEMMYFDCNLFQSIQIIGFIHLRVTAFSKEAQDQVPVLEKHELSLTLEATVLAAVLVSDPFELLDVHCLLLLQLTELVLQPTFLVLHYLEFECVHLALLVFVDTFESTLIALQIVDILRVLCISSLLKAIWNLRQLLLLDFLAALLEFLNLSLLMVDLSEPIVQFLKGLAFFPELAETSALPLSLQSAEPHGLIVEPDSLVPPVDYLQIDQLPVKGRLVSLLLLLVSLHHLLHLPHLALHNGEKML